MVEQLRFPQKLFRKRFGIGLDLGGSCCKIAYTTDEEDHLRFHLAIFSKQRVEDAIGFIKNTCGDKLVIGEEITTCGITVNMKNQSIQDILQIRIRNVSEMVLMASAFQFMLKSLPWEMFIQNPAEDSVKLGLQQAKRSQNVMKSFTKDPKMFLPEDKLENIPDYLDKPPSNIEYPIFLNVAGSVPFPLLVKEDGSVSFHTWNPIGGKAFCGLGSYIARTKSFEELHAIAESGDRTQVDEWVRDIVGSDSSDDFYASMSDDGVDFIAHSYGKLWNKQPDDVNKADIVSALLSNNIYHMVREFCLWAALFNIKQVFFCGSMADSSDYIRDKITTSYILETYSHGVSHKSDHYFVRYGSYLGAIGALLANLQIIEDDTT